MTRLLLVLAALVLAGCSPLKTPMPAEPVPVAARQAPAPELVDAQGTPIERVPFRSGVSSVTVENLAKAEGCTGGKGAGLVTNKGPVEVYRMMCENGKVFMARCELRQCRKM